MKYPEWVREQKKFNGIEWGKNYDHWIRENGLVGGSSIPNLLDLANNYKDNILEYCKPTRRHKFQMERVIANCGVDFSGNYLEIGCMRGEVTFARSIQFPNARIAALEFCPVLVDLCVRLNKIFKRPNIEFVLGSIEETELMEQFDIIDCSQLLDHVFDPQLVLSRIKKLLKPEGYLIGSVFKLNNLVREHMRSFFTTNDLINCIKIVFPNNKVYHLHMHGAGEDILIFEGWK